MNECAANMIAESLLKIFDPEGFSLMLMYSIVDFKEEDTAINMVNKYLSLLMVRRDGGILLLDRNCKCSRRMDHSYDFLLRT